MVVGHGEDAVLVVMLKVREPEETVLPERTAQAEARLTPREEWIGVGRIPAQSGVGRKVVVPEIKESSAMERIAASAGDNVDRTGPGHSGRQIEAETGDLNFLYRLLGEVLGRTPIDAIFDRGTVD